MKLEVKKNTIKGTFWGWLERICTLILPFVIRTIVIRNLGSEYAGLGSLFSSILSVLNLTELGFGTAVVYAMYKPIAEDNDNEFNALLNFFRKTYSKVGIAILFLGVCVLPFLKKLIKGGTPPDVNVYALFLIYLLNTALSYLMFAYRSSILRAYQRTDVISAISLITNTVMYSVQIILLCVTRNYYFYVIAILIATILTNFLTLFYTKKKYKKIKPIGEIGNNQKKELITKIKALLLHKIGGTVLNSADTIVISYFAGLVVLSNFNNYYFVQNAVSSFIIVFFSSLTAGIGNSLQFNGIEENRDNFYEILFLNGCIVSLCTVCLFSAYQVFIPIWVGIDKLLDIKMVILFCTYFFLHMIRRTILTYRDAAGLWNQNKWQPIVSSIFNLMFNIVLYPYIGLYGILLSSVCAMLLIDIPWESKITTISIFKESPKRYYLYIIYFAVISAMSCLTVYIITNMINANKYIQLICNILVAVIITVVFIFMLTMWMPEPKKLYYEFKKKYNNRQ